MRDLSTRRAVAFGVDLAKTVDFTVVVGLDSNRVVSEFRRFQAPWPDTRDRIMGAVGTRRALVDATGVGDPIMDDLVRLRHGRYEPYKFSAPKKQQLMEGLAVAIQSGTVRFPDGPIRLELESFEYEYKERGRVYYSAPSGSHDDCVVALGLAVKLFNDNRSLMGADRPDTADVGGYQQAEVPVMW